MKANYDIKEVEYDRELAAQLTTVARSFYAIPKDVAVASFVTNHSIMVLASNLQKDDILTVSDTDIEKFSVAIAEYERNRGSYPDIILVKNLGLIVCSSSRRKLEEKRNKFLKEHFELTAENYAMPSYPLSSGRLYGKLTLITGAAQGFGKGLSLQLAEQGAIIGVADLNYDGAVKTAAEINEKYGIFSATAIKVDVGDEESVKNMCSSFALEYGGIDIFISNAGVLKAGSLDDTDFKTIEFITRINYIGYFLGAKYSSKLMKIAHAVVPKKYFDIIQINSKSGLEGSNKNFCYAGSKFGGIGLTQSFALELVPFNIKVNSICPGNFLDGPLWCDPVKGLFVQYLASGKVLGAKTIADVKAYYEGRVPMNRGCTEIDVARAVMYLVEQLYETGQALPVTGGQVMLN